MSQDKLGKVALVSSAFKLCIFSGIEGDLVHFEILAFEEKLIPIKYDLLAIYQSTLTPRAQEVLLPEFSVHFLK